MICAHKDEIGMLIRGIRDDGRLEVEACGGALPWKYGEGPVDVISDSGRVVTGILSVGSTHTDSGPLAELKTSRALTWDLVTIFTGLSPIELAHLGIHIGCRAVIARDRKRVHRLGEYIAGFGLDDRMGLVSLIAGLNSVSAARASGEYGSLDLYFVASWGEELGMLGGVRAAHLLDPDDCIALDTAPVTPDSGLSVDARPVIWYRETSYHDKPACDRLLALAEELGFGGQAGLNPCAGMDSAAVRQLGLAGRTVSFGPGRDNSHGCEIAHKDAMHNVTQLLLAYLRALALESEAPVSGQSKSVPSH
jgi:putative aminopeptidase FrvX